MNKFHVFDNKFLSTVLRIRASKYNIGIGSHADKISNTLYSISMETVKRVTFLCGTAIVFEHFSKNLHSVSK